MIHLEQLTRYCTVVEADYINTFISRLDCHWISRDLVSNFNSELTGTGNLLICM